MKLMPLTRTELLKRIDELLEISYRSADLGNFDDPLAETVYILLSHQTQEPVYRPLFAELRRRYPRWLDVLAAPEEELVELLKPGGFFRQRAGKLRKLLAAVELTNRARGIGPSAQPPADLTLDFLHTMTDAEAETFLVSLPGVGPKTARCVLSYSLARAAFAVDTHVHRIFTRLDLIESNGRKRDHDPFQEAVPDHLRKRLHVNLVHHGRVVCTAQGARCGECVLVSFCGRGREAAGEADTRPVAVDLFAGAGGKGRGFRDADNGTLQVRTYREGLAQKVGHDLSIDVGQWEAAAEVRQDGTLSAVQLNADPHSLQVREGLHGVKPLTDKDRADIRKTIDEKILGGRPIAFRSTAVEPADGGLTVRGELELAGTRRPASFELNAAADGRVRGTLPVTQSEWGIKPYRGMMGALKVRDTIEVVLDVPLPSD